jgi:hypothetical protein
MASMSDVLIRSSEVRKLLFDFPQWDRRRAPEWIDDVFCKMVEGVPYEQLVPDIFDQFSPAVVYPMPVAGCVAALAILKPGGNIRCLLSLIETRLEEQSLGVGTAQGCILGLFTASAMGGGHQHFGWSYRTDELIPELEQKLWPLIVKLSLHLETLDRSDFKNAGELSNVLSAYLSPDEKVKRLRSQRHNRMRTALTRLPENLKAAGLDGATLKPEGVAHCLFKEMVYKTFGHMSLVEQINLLSRHFRK